MITRVLIGMGIVALAAFGTVELMRRQSLFYPDKYPIGDWDATGIQRKPEDIWFASADGTKLHGWLIRADEPSAPLIVFFHGNGGNLTHRLVPAVKLADHGMSVFLFDYRGYGRSEGSPSEQKLYDDALAAWDTMRESHDGAMIAYGESLGGPYAAYVSSKREPCVAIMDSTFPSAGAVARAIYDPLPVHWLVRPGLETARHLNDASVPVLVMHSTADDVIPFELGRELFDAIEGPKQMFESKTAPHAGISWYDADRYYEAIRTFVSASCGEETRR